MWSHALKWSLLCSALCVNEKNVHQHCVPKDSIMSVWSGWLMICPSFILLDWFSNVFILLVERRILNVWLQLRVSLSPTVVPLAYTSCMLKPFYWWHFLKFPRSSWWIDSFLFNHLCRSREKGRSMFFPTFYHVHFQIYSDIHYYVYPLSSGLLLL